MGGSTDRGNTTPAAEFNIMVDPEAAAAVFESGLPLTMIGLNLTHQALATPDVLARIRRCPASPPAPSPLDRVLRRRLRERDGAFAPPVHDPSRSGS